MLEHEARLLLPDDGANAGGNRCGFLGEGAIGRVAYFQVIGASKTLVAFGPLDWAKSRQARLTQMIVPVSSRIATWAESASTIKLSEHSDPESDFGGRLRSLTSRVGSTWHPSGETPAEHTMRWSLFFLTGAKTGMAVGFLGADYQCGLRLPLFDACIIFRCSYGKSEVERAPLPDL